MESGLSRNEIEILDRQVGALNFQLSEMAASLESRLGENNELAAAARNAEREFAKLVQRVRRRVAFESTRGQADSQTA
jgi:hypothetical protein